MEREKTPSACQGKQGEVIRENPDCHSVISEGLRYLWMELVTGVSKLRIHLITNEESMTLRKAQQTLNPKPSTLNRVSQAGMAKREQLST